MTDQYTQDYRHFDNLIWQVPAWATAVFSFAMTSSVLGLANAASLERILCIDASTAVAFFLFVVFALLLQFMNVFLRFRLHQRAAFRPQGVDIPRLWFMVPGQTSLLLMLFLEASAILSLALITTGAPPVAAQAVAAAFLLGGFPFVETRVRRLSNTIKAARESAAREQASPDPATQRAPEESSGAGLDASAPDGAGRQE